MDDEKRMNMLKLNIQANVRVGQKHRPSSSERFLSLKNILRVQTFPGNEVLALYPKYSKPAKYPSMQAHEDRKTTFKKRTNCFQPHDISTLAGNGFYYDGIIDGSSHSCDRHRCSHNRDTLRCFYCGLGLQDLGELNPNMITKTHAKFSPYCGHLRQTVPDAVLNVYKKESPCLQTEGQEPSHLKQGVFVSVRYFGCAARRAAMPQIGDQAATNAIADDGFFFRAIQPSPMSCLEVVCLHECLTLMRTVLRHPCYTESMVAAPDNRKSTLSPSG